MAKWVIEAELPFGALTVTKDGVPEPHVESVEFTCDIKGIPTLSIGYTNIDPRTPIELTPMLGSDPQFLGTLDNSLHAKLGNRANVRRIRIETEGNAVNTYIFVDNEQQHMVQNVYLSAVLNDTTEFKVTRYMFDTAPTKDKQ